MGRSVFRQVNIAVTANDRINIGPIAPLPLSRLPTHVASTVNFSKLEESPGFNVGALCTYLCIYATLPVRRKTMETLQFNVYNAHFCGIMQIGNDAQTQTQVLMQFYL